MSAHSSNVSGRILLDIPCKVCHDHSSGKHYGIFACDGCAGFFKRSIRRNRQYVCKNRGTGTEGACTVDKTHRNQCRACRLTKCIGVGMNKDAVQHERGPRNSTLRRQMALYFKENALLAGAASAGDTAGSPPTSRKDSASQPQPPTSAAVPTSLGPFGLLRPPPFPILPPHFPFPGLYGGTMGGFPLWPGMLHGAFNAAANGPGVTASDSMPPSENPSPLYVATASPPNGKMTPSDTNTSSGSGGAPPARPVVKEEGETSGGEEASPSPPKGKEGARSPGGEAIALKEQAARLLFTALHWPKTLPQFQALPQAAQVEAMGECWSGLFLLTAAGSGLLSEETLTALGAGDGALRGATAAIADLGPDHVELCCLRALLLLSKSGGWAMEQAQLALASYHRLQYPNQPARGLQLLLILPALKKVSGEVVESVFFRDSIGSVRMERLVCDLYVSQPGPPNLPFPAPLPASATLIQPDAQHPPSFDQPQDLSLTRA